MHSQTHCAIRKSVFVSISCILQSIQDGCRLNLLFVDRAEVKGHWTATFPQPGVAATHVLLRYLPIDAFHRLAGANEESVQLHDRFSFLCERCRTYAGPSSGP